MALKTLPPRDLVRQLLDYDPETGVFTWRPRPREMFPAGWHFMIWNNRFAGKPAGTLTRLGYLRININHAFYMAHRLAWLIVHGEPVPDNLDHKDRNSINNRIKNLRPATHSQNLMNMKQQANRTGARGVYRVTNSNRFMAQITVNGKTHHIGSFDTIEEAAKARSEAAIRLHGEFAAS